MSDLQQFAPYCYMTQKGVIYKHEMVQGSINGGVKMIGVGIPTCDRHGVLQECIGAIDKQTFRGEISYIQIIDNNREQTLDVDSIRQVTGLPIVLTKPSSALYASPSHNVCLDFAKGRVPMFMRWDDDQIMQEDFLQKLYITMQTSHKCVAVGGLYPDGDHGDTQNDKDGFCQMGTWSRPWIREVGHLFSSFLYRVDKMDFAGGFCEDYWGWFQETDASLRIKHLCDGKLYVNGGAIAQHKRASGGLRHWHESQYAQRDRAIFEQRMRSYNIKVPS